jgi:hypothetical protein
MADVQRWATPTVQALPWKASADLITRNASVGGERIASFALHVSDLAGTLYV